MLVTIDDCMLT